MNNMPQASLPWTMKKNSPRSSRPFEYSRLEKSIISQADSQPERFHLFLAHWRVAMTKKWNETLPGIKNFKLPSPAFKALPFPCFISFKPVSWYLKVITFPFECCLPITFLHTCEHEDFLLPINVLVTRWSHFCTSVTLHHHCFLYAFPDTWHKNVSGSSIYSSHWRNWLVILHIVHTFSYEKKGYWRTAQTEGHQACTCTNSRLT